MVGTGGGVVVVVEEAAPVVAFTAVALDTVLTARLLDDRPELFRVEVARFLGEALVSRTRGSTTSRITTSLSMMVVVADSCSGCGEEECWVSSQDCAVFL